MITIVILYALFAATFSLGKALVSYTSFVFAVGIRMFVAGVILLAYQYFNKTSVFKLRTKHIWLYVQVMLFSTYVPYLLRFWGLRYMQPAKASLLFCLSPFISYLFGYLLANEKITRKKIIGLSIGFVSMLPVFIVSVPTEDIIGGIGFFSWPEIVMLMSVTSIAYGWIMIGKLVRYKNYSPAMANGISMFTGGALALLTSFLSVDLDGYIPQRISFEFSFPVTDWVPFLTVLSFLIIVSNLICHNLYAHLLRKYSPTLLSFAGLLTPLFAAFYSWILLGETVNWTFFVAIIGVCFGLWLFYQDELKEQNRARKKNPKPSIEEIEIDG